MAVERPAPPVSGEEVREEVANEIVGALNAVVGFSQLLSGNDGHLAPDTRERYSAHVREGSSALRRLVLGVLGIEPSSPTKRGADSGAHAVAKPAMLPPDDGRTYASLAPDVLAPESTVRIFVAEPDTRNRELLVANLDGRGYDVQAFATGDEARSYWAACPPDMLLVSVADDGAFAAAQALKVSDAYAPVIFLVDVGDDRARTRALEAGAEQILERPISRHDLRARVKNLLNLRKNQLALAAQNEQLRKLQSFKDEMAALMVHDLKSPLSAIAMNLDVALSGLPEEAGNDDVRGALEDCRVASARLFRMIANLLDIAKSEDGRLAPRTSPVDLRQLIVKIAQEHLTEAKLRNVHVSWDADVEGLYDLDPDLLGRVVENLIENGLRYTRPGGHLRVITADLGTLLEVRVANDGPPIPKEARAHIFEKYGQAPTPGATRVNRGLGLYFCRVAAEAHGGTIALFDEPDMTTCFSVRLPRKLVAH